METESRAHKIQQFGEHLHFFMWTKVNDSSLVREMGHVAKFADKYEKAAASYLKWLKDGYPKVKLENREEQKKTNLVNLFNIFETHCPNHPIFEFLDE